VTELFGDFDTRGRVGRVRLWVEGAAHRVQGGCARARTKSHGPDPARGPRGRGRDARWPTPWQTRSAPQSRRARSRPRGGAMRRRRRTARSRCSSRVRGNRASPCGSGSIARPRHRAGVLLTLGVIDARSTCHALGIPHVTPISARSSGAASSRPSVRGYQAAETPNPCVRCNASFRFGAGKIPRVSHEGAGWTADFADCRNRPLRAHASSRTSPALTFSCAVRDERL